MAGVDRNFPRLDRLLAYRYRSIVSEIREELGHSNNRADWAAADLVAELEDHSAADFLADLGRPSVDRHLPELRHILRARRRIRQGTYGICEACGASMPVPWLETHLTAMLCADCQRLG